MCDCSSVELALRDVCVQRVRLCVDPRLVSMYLHSKAFMLEFVYKVCSITLTFPYPPLLPPSRYDRDARGYRDSYRDGGGYRDSYRDSYRERDRGDRRYGSTYDDSRARDYRGGGGGRYEDYYDRYDYDRYRSGGYDHYADHYYDDRYRDYSKYADYREGYRRSRSPGGRGGDYYSSKDRRYIRAKSVLVFSIEV